MEGYCNVTPKYWLVPCKYYVSKVLKWKLAPKGRCYWTLVLRSHIWGVPQVFRYNQLCWAIRFMRDYNELPQNTLSEARFSGFGTIPVSEYYFTTELSPSRAELQDSIFLAFLWLILKYIWYMLSVLNTIFPSLHCLLFLN